MNDLQCCFRVSGCIYVTNTGFIRVLQYKIYVYCLVSPLFSLHFFFCLEFELVYRQANPKWSLFIVDGIPVASLFFSEDGEELRSDRA